MKSNDHSIYVVNLSKCPVDNLRISFCLIPESRNADLPDLLLNNFLSLKYPQRPND
jgi:hypothetical protein